MPDAPPFSDVARPCSLFLGSGDSTRAPRPRKNVKRNEELQSWWIADRDVDFELRRYRTGSVIQGSQRVLSLTVPSLRQV